MLRFAKAFFITAAVLVAGMMVWAVVLEFI